MARMASSMEGSPRIHQELIEVGEKCSVHRVTRLMRNSKIKTQRGCNAVILISGEPR